uniref:Uncharacterized protein n=1 Tax=Quercus lobata TaxID=97700 RepID=A0A7N2LLR4_QUELO
MDHLDNETNKVMAMVIIESIMKNYPCISTAHQVEVLFELIKGLIKDLDGTVVDELEEEDFNEEQNSVARLIHMLYNDDPEELLKILVSIFIILWIVNKIVNLTSRIFAEDFNDCYSFEPISLEEFVYPMHIL